MPAGRGNFMRDGWKHLYIAIRPVGKLTECCLEWQDVEAHVTPLRDTQRRCKSTVARCDQQSARRCAERHDEGLDVPRVVDVVEYDERPLLRHRPGKPLLCQFDRTLGRKTPQS